MKLKKSRLIEIINEEISLFKKKQQLKEILRREVSDILVNEISTAFHSVKGGKERGYKSPKQVDLDKLVKSKETTRDAKKAKYDTKKAAKLTKKQALDTRKAKTVTAKQKYDTAKAAAATKLKTLNSAKTTTASKKSALDSKVATETLKLKALDTAKATKLSTEKANVDAKSEVEKFTNTNKYKTVKTDVANKEKLALDLEGDAKKAATSARDAKTKLEEETTGKGKGRYLVKKLPQAVPKLKWTVANGPFKSPLQADLAYNNYVAGLKPIEARSTIKPPGAAKYEDHPDWIAADKDFKLKDDAAKKTQLDFDKAKKEYKEVKTIWDDLQNDLGKLEATVVTTKKAFDDASAAIAPATSAYQSAVTAVSDAKTEHQNAISAQATAQTNYNDAASDETTTENEYTSTQSDESSAQTEYDDAASEETAAEEEHQSAEDEWNQTQDELEQQAREDAEREEVGEDPPPVGGYYGSRGGGGPGSGRGRGRGKGKGKKKKKK